MSATEFLIVFWTFWGGWQARCWWLAAPGTADRWLSGLLVVVNLATAVAWACVPPSPAPAPEPPLVPYRATTAPPVTR